jgi:hypothetical protein
MITCIGYVVGEGEGPMFETSEFFFKNGDDFIIGRADNSGVVTLQEHTSVSGHHLYVKIYGSGRVEITDLGSKNGTRVVGESLYLFARIPHVLIDEEETPAEISVQVGNNHLRFRLTGHWPTPHALRAAGLPASEPMRTYRLEFYSYERDV